jgi:hypothetical protein
MSQKVRYLIQRDSGFYARIVVPARLRPIIRKRELSAPLRATSRAEAMRKLPAVVAELRAMIENTQAEAKVTRSGAQPRRSQVLTPRELAVAHYDTQMRFDDELRDSDDRYSHGFVDERYVQKT